MDRSQLGWFFFNKCHGLLLLGLLSAFYACSPEINEDVRFYTSDFGSGNLENFTNAKLGTFNEKSVVGFYHNDTVTLSLSGLPAHDALKISFELYVHDSWDGNVMDVGGPDLWMLDVDGVEIMRTTFSNSPCTSSYCLQQSFPGTYPSFNNPKTGATSGTLPGRCQYQNVAGWTSVYHLTQLVPHRGNAVEIRFRDQIKQTNARNALCDESWSLGSVSVSTVTIR